LLLDEADPQPQPGTCRSCKITGTGSVCRTACLFTPAPNYTAWWQRQCLSHPKKMEKS